MAFPYPLRSHLRGGGNIAAVVSPFLDYTGALCAGTFGQQKLLVVIFFRRLVPVLPGHGAEVARPLSAPPLIYLFFGQQGGAGFFAFADDQVIDRWPLRGCGERGMSL